MYNSKSADIRFHKEAVRKMFVEIREKMEQARARSRYERLEGGERRHREIETEAISWGRTPEDAKAFYALHRYGWDRLRIQVELTTALACHGKDLVRKLLRDLEPAWNVAEFNATSMQPILKGSARNCAWPAAVHTATETMVEAPRLG